MPSGGIPSGGIPRGAQPPRRPNGPGAPGGIPGAPGNGRPGAPGGRPGGPAGPGAAAGSVPGGPPQRPSTPPGGVRRPGGPVGPGAPVGPGGRPPVGGPGGPRRPGGPGPERRPGEEPTDLLPPVQQSTPREPQLLTHREDEVEVEPFYDDEYDEELTEAEARVVRRKRIWRRVRRTTYVALGLMMLAPVVAFAIAYQVVEVPIPEEIAAQQGKAISIRYSDGSEMVRIASGEANRTMIKYEDLPDSIKQAVFAAEDPTFETNLGFDMTAIARAVYYQVTGGDSGGSGLTQQYVKKATGKEDGTITRKFNEMVTAYKMSEQQDKKDILTAYLNTIYFGKGAYGIKTAAKAYFGIDDLQQVTHSQAALLAGMIQNPSRSEQAAYTAERWDYVMRRLLEMNWITQEYRDTEQFPVIVEQAEQGGLTGARLHIRQQILNEMSSEKVDWDLEKLQSIGGTVHTTIDPAMQAAAEQAVDEVMRGQNPELRTSMSAIDPATGAVKAYWGGADGGGIDYQTGTLQEPGSSFKPFDFVAALQAGEGAGEVYDGSSPREFPGRTGANSVKNSPGVACRVPKQCTVREAMVKSVNTVFFDMALKLGTGKVAEAAHQAGIPREVTIGDTTTKLLVGEGGTAPDGNISIGGGQTLVRPFDITTAYATFAARGVYHEPFFITKIVNTEDQPVYQRIDESRPAFDPDPKKSQDIADNVTDVLKGIPTGKIACAGGRECAGKTGTHELQGSTENAKAWMAGYTPTLAASVWLGTDAGNIALKEPNGRTDIYGSGVPGQIWKRFMDKALNGAPMEKFPRPNPIGQFEEPKITTTTTTTTPTTTTEKRDDDRPPSQDKPTTTTPTTTTTTTRTGGPCRPPLCTTTSQEPEPDPIGGGGAPPSG
ncbi:transglycosylase domain-containing protein [Saccharothrix yanglingensis]|uniref:Glycosyl transferase n=1 Tax=Saccharothrix yanglingensis TaxID=659496 RepID=A0ABU0WTZ4_9PSEU|nr:transglycosylase domain-containing protein [Saccharothrix yanglingensis]MDQ2583008.1 glycosyl transferase [Saccharothrix yanglingensis]